MTKMLTAWRVPLSLFACVLPLAACGGGGGGSLPPSGPPGPIGPTPGPTPAPVTGQTVTGTVVSIPQGTYGAAAPQAPLAGATVVVGNTLIQGATLPPTLPGNDVITTTGVAGAFSMKVGPPVSPPSSSALYTFVPPYDNVFHVAFPSRGYFVMVFPAGSDGKSAGAHLPVHAFVAAGANGALGLFRSTTPSSDEAGWLVQANLDRGAKGQLPEIFDEAAEEAARQHANDMLAEQSLCDYNQANQGPQTFYDLLGGLGQQDANIAIYGGPPTTTTAYWHSVENAFLAEANLPPPNNYHYANLMYPSDVWMGLAVTSGPFLQGGPGGAFYAADMVNVNVVDPVALVANVGSCPAGIVANGS